MNLGSIRKWRVPLKSLACRLRNPQTKQNHIYKYTNLQNKKCLPLCLRRLTKRGTLQSTFQNSTRVYKIHHVYTKSHLQTDRETQHTYTQKKKSRQEWEEEEQDMVLTEDKLIKVEFGEKCTKITNHFSCR